MNPISEVETADDADSADSAGLAAGRCERIYSPAGGGGAVSILVIREIRGSYFGFRDEARLQCRTFEVGVTK